MSACVFCSRSACRLTRTSCFTCIRPRWTSSGLRYLRKHMQSMSIHNTFLLQTYQFYFYCRITSYISRRQPSASKLDFIFLILLQYLFKKLESYSVNLGSIAQSPKFLIQNSHINILFSHIHRCDMYFKINYRYFAISM